MNRAPALVSSTVTKAVIQRSGKSPILQNQEQKPDQQKKVLPDSGAPVTAGAPVSAKVYLFPQDHLLSEESVDEILMEYIFGNVIGQNPKDGTKIQLNLSLSPEGDLIGVGLKGTDRHR